MDIEHIEGGAKEISYQNNTGDTITVLIDRDNNIAEFTISFSPHNQIRFEDVIGLNAFRSRIPGAVAGGIMPHRTAVTKKPCSGCGK